MILKSIKVSNWRSLLGDVELGPFSQGLNVIHAPNGTGKSSLFEAMRRGLFDAHHVSGTEITAIQPWGRDLTPAVTIEFIEGDTTWRVEKAFLAGKSAKLSRWEDAAFVPVADGRNADERIREILSADAPGRGLSKQEHWGLAQILWAPQGELHLSQISGSSAEQLKAALGVQVSGNSGGLIEDHITERFLTFFTKKGVLKTGKHAAPVIALAAEKDKLSAELVQLRDRHLAFEQAAHSVEDARQRRLQARHEAEALRGTVTITRANAEAFAKLKAEQSNKREAESLAKEKFDALSARQQQLLELRQSISTLTQTLNEQSAKLAELQREEARASEAVASKRSAREAERAKRKIVAERQQSINAARDFLAQSANAQALEKRSAAIAALQTQLAEAKAQLNAVMAPSPKVIRALREWVAKRERAAAALKASQVHLEITPEVAITVTDGTNQQSTSVAAGTPIAFSGDDWVDVSVAGFGCIRASGPEGSAQTQRVALDKATAEIHKLSQPFGTDDPDKLQLLREQADQLNRKVTNCTDRIEQLLDTEDWDTLQSQQAQLKAQIAEALHRQPDWQNNPPVLSQLQADYDALCHAVDDAIAAAEDAFERAQAHQNASLNAVTVCAAELKVFQAKLDDAQQQLESLCRDGLSDAARQQAIDQALMTWQAARTAAQQAESSLHQFPDDPSKELAILERQLAAHEETEAKARDAEKTAEGLLQSLAAEGTYSKLVAAEEAVATIEASLAEQSIRMDAVKLLHDTVGTCKAQMLASVSAPVERSATRMLSRIVGPRLGQLSLSSEFVPSAIHPEIASDPVALHNLSGGEQEQLFLVARLALAEVLAKHQRQLLVLDDVLNATDAGRLARLLALMEEVADRLQIVILTCHPERYRALDNATFFALSR